MSVIRSAVYRQTLLISSEGKITEEKQQTIPDVFDEEYKKAYAKGLEQGDCRGYQKALSEIKSLSNLLSALAEKLLEQRARLLEHLKPEMIEFCFDVCEKILRQQLANKELFIHLMRSLIDTFIEKERLLGSIHVFLSPEDFEVLENSRELTAFDKSRFQWKKEASMPRGNVKIESESGILHFDIARELENLQEMVLQK